MNITALLEKKSDPNIVSNHVSVAFCSTFKMRKRKTEKSDAVNPNKISKSGPKKAIQDFPWFVVQEGERTKGKKVFVRFVTKPMGRVFTPKSTAKFSRPDKCFDLKHLRGHEDGNKHVLASGGGNNVKTFLIKVQEKIDQRTDEFYTKVFWAASNEVPFKKKSIL